MRQHPFLTDLAFTALNGVHQGVLRASEGHIGGSCFDIDPDVTVASQRITERTRVGAPEEAVNLWSQVVRADWPYGGDQRRSPRDTSHALLELR
ncbi:MAG: hypothetical protein WA860_07410 [Acidimicrobiales bacterium]